jgi:hypothetical protein
MCLHSEDDKVVFALVRLRFVETMWLDAGITKHSNRLCGESWSSDVCVMSIPCADDNLHPRARPFIWIAPNNQVSFHTGLLRKRMEGVRKVQEAVERRAHGNCPVPAPLSTYQVVFVCEIAEVLSSVGGLYSEPASGLRWENMGKDEPVEGWELDQEHEKLRVALRGKA